MTTTSIPTGHRRDAQGRLVPEGNIKPVDKLRDELVRELHADALDLHHAIAAFKAKCFDSIAAFVDLSANQYGVSVGGTKGNVTLASFDGSLKVLRAMAEHITFDERLLAAKELIDECLREWTINARPEITVLVQDAFKVDVAGNIRTGSVLALRRIDIKDSRWLEAMAAISDAVQVTGSKSYVRFYTRDNNDMYQAVSLDIAGV